MTQHQGADNSFEDKHMNIPSISVLVPVFNEGNYIQQCLDSILEQQKASFEICVADNCSTDNTWEIVSKYAIEDARIKIFRHAAPVHPFDNWLSTLQMATGRYVYHIGGDDYFLPGFFTEAISQFNANPDLTGFLVSMNYFSDQTNKILETLPPPNFEDGLNQQNDQLVKFLLNHCNNDEIMYGVFERSQFTKAVSLIDKTSFEQVGFWVFLSIMVVAAKDYRSRIIISKSVYLMKRYEKHQGQNSNFARSARGSKNKIVYYIDQWRGSLRNILRLKSHGLISRKATFLLLFASRYHSSFGWHSFGPALDPFALVARKVLFFARKLTAPVAPRQ